MSTQKRKAEDSRDDGEEGAGDENVTLTSFSSLRPERVPRYVMRGSCRSISDYAKLNRLGEGTYGVVCE